MKKVSIIVPVYNSENYLPNCLDTLVNQTYKNIEIILINDGSKDNSLQICQEVAEEDNRIKVFSIENSGVSTARNIGIENATGDYITFVDSDDWIELNMIEFAVTKTIEDDADTIIWSYFKNFLDSERPLPLIPGGNQTFTDEKDILYLKSIYQFYGQEKLGDTVSAGTTWCKLYKSELIRNNNIRFKKELTRSQDVIFCLEAFSKSGKIKYYDENLYHYRINNSSTCSGSRFIADTETPFNSLLNEMKKFSVKFKENTEFNEAVYARTVQVLLWHLEHKYFHKKFEGNVFRRKREVLKTIMSEPYNTALKEVNKNLLPKKERTMVILLNKKFVLCFYYIYKLHQLYVNRTNRKFD